MAAPDAASRVAALQFTADMASFWDRLLRRRLLGTYLIGSLAHGGFSRRYSDIDMAVIAEDGLSTAELAAMQAHAAALAPELAMKLSLFWADRDFSIGRFPPLDRVDLVDHAVALVERDRVRPPRPTLANVRAYLGGMPFASWADGARRFAASAALETRDHKPYLRALLYPARFAFSWITGGMGSNDDAVAFVRARAPPGLDLELLGRALACRRAASDPDPLFPARDRLPRQIDACRRVMQAGGGQ